MVEVKRGRGRPRKNIEVKRPVGRPPKKKMGRPKGSKNKTKIPIVSLTLEQRIEVIELTMSIIIDIVSKLSDMTFKKKAR